MIDMSKLSDKDILALANGDMNSLSDDGLLLLSGLTPKGRPGIVESAVGSAKRGMISAGTALKAPFGAEEAAKAGAEAEQAVEERPGFNWEDIKKKYEQEGLLSALGEGAAQIPGTISEQAPTLGAIFTGGRLGAMGGAELGGMIGNVPGAALGAAVGGIGGAALYPFLTQSGENIQRQYQEQVAKGETPDISLSKAYGAGAGQAALEMIGGPEALLAKRLGKKTAEEISQDTLQSLAKQSTVEGLLRGTGRVMAEEIPTEIGQQILERAQAGLPISPSDQQALDEYLASGVGAALAGPIGGPMRVMESQAARSDLADQERKRQEEEVKKAEEDRIASLYGGQRTIPGIEDIEPITREEEKVTSDPLQNAVDYLRSLPQEFTNPSQVKAALAGSEFESVGPKKVLDLYKTTPVQEQLFDETGELTPYATRGYEQQQEAGEVMGKKLEQAKPGETLDLFGKAKPIQYAPEELAQEQPSQGGSANLMVQQAMKEAEQQTAIDQANRARQTLYGQPEGAPMGYESAERRAQAIEESAPFIQKAADLQQQLQQQALAEQQQKSDEAMAKKLEQAKPGETLDLFGKARPAQVVPEEVSSEQPSQGGSANLQIQEAIKQAERDNDIEKANQLRQQLYGTPEGELLSPAQQQQRVEAEPFKALAEQKAADLKAIKEEGRLPEEGVTKETLTTLHPDLAKTAIGKRVAANPANYSMSNAEGLKDVIKSLKGISEKKPELAPSINPFLNNLEKHVEGLSKQPVQGKLFSKTDQSNLNANNQPIAQTPEATKNFWNWFGDSKVKDTEGKPMVLYHGTDADFDEFDSNAIRKEGRRTSVDSGISLSYSPDFASEYAKKENGRVIPVYVNAKRIWKNDEQGIEDLKKAYESKYGEAMPDYRVEYAKEGWWGAVEGLLKQLQEYGYDAAQVNEAGSENLHVFNPTQIKSATGNQGTFSPEEKSIVKSKAKTPTNAHTAETLQQELNKRYGNNAPKVNIGTRADVDNDSTVQGFYDPATKSVTLIPENIDQSKDLHGLIRHEIAVHAKRLGKTDAEFKDILKQLKVLKESNKAVQEAYAKVPKDTAAESVDEEALGYLVEHAKNLPLVKRFMSWLRRMAHKLTGSSSWLRADDFAKLADEVLSSKTSTEAVAREKLSPSYSKSQQPTESTSVKMRRADKRVVAYNDQYKFSVDVGDLTISFAPAPHEVFIDKKGLGLYDKSEYGDGFIVRPASKGDFRHGVLTEKNLSKWPKDISPQLRAALIQYVNARTAKEDEAAQDAVMTALETALSGQQKSSLLYSKSQPRTEFDVPEKATKKSIQAIVNEKKTLAKQAATLDGVKTIANNIRKATTNQAAFIASKDYQKTMGKLTDQQNEVIASVLVDQALDGDKYAAAAAHTGKVVVTKNGIEVVKDNNNVENVFKQVEALGKKIGDLDEAKNIVNRYLLARRYDNIMKSGEGHVSAEQQRLTKQFLGLDKQYPELTKISDMVYALQHDLLDFMSKSGIITEKKADKYKSEKGYVPLYRIMDDIETTNPGMKQYFGGLTDIGTEKAFKGSDRETLDVLDNMMTRYMWAVQSGARNFAMQKIAKDYGVVDQNNKTKYYSHEPKHDKEYFAPVMVDGKRRWVQYADPKIPAAVQPVASLGPVLSLFSGASRILRTGVTALPTFGAAQVVMDSQRAALFSGVNRPFELMGRVLKSYGTLSKDVFSDITKDLTGKPFVEKSNDKTIETLHAHGISGGYGHTTQEITNRMRRQVGLETTNLITKIWDRIDDIAAASDMAQRKAIYEQTMKETGDEVLALHRARNIINWRHRGDNAAVHVITQVVPFANAYAQSMDVMLSAMAGSGISGKSKLQAMAQFYKTAMLMAGISAIYTMAMSGDDDYEKMSEREKLGSFLIPGTDGVTIPVPSDIGLLYKAIPELAWHYITKDSVTNPRDVTKLRKALGEAILDSVSGPNLMPQLIKGVLEVETNHNFMTGKPIVGHGMEFKEPFKQYAESTSEVAKSIGKLMNWSPVKVDHLIKAYTGTVGSLSLMVTDQLINAVSDVKRPDTHWYKNPMVSRFMADPRYKSQIDDYYDLLERSNIVTNTIADYRKHGDTEGGREYREANKEMTRVRQQVLNLQNQMTMIRDRRNRIVDAKGLSAEEKATKIEALDERTGHILRNIEKIRLRAGL